VYQDDGLDPFTIHAWYLSLYYISTGCDIIKFIPQIMLYRKIAFYFGLDLGSVLLDLIAALAVILQYFVNDKMILMTKNFLVHFNYSPMEYIMNLIIILCNIIFLLQFLNLSNNKNNINLEIKFPPNNQVEITDNFAVEDIYFVNKYFSIKKLSGQNIEHFRGSFELLDNVINNNSEISNNNICNNNNNNNNNNNCSYNYYNYKYLL